MNICIVFHIMYVHSLDMLRVVVVTVTHVIVGDSRGKSSDLCTFNLIILANIDETEWCPAIIK